MSSINIGDWVMVTRPSKCCGVTSYMGAVFKVAAVDHGPGMCGGCETENHELGALLPKEYYREMAHLNLFITFYRLTKLPGEPVDVEKSEEITA